jgi:hypothetical protein
LIHLVFIRVLQGKIAILGISRQQALSFQVAANAMGDGVGEFA